MTIHVLLPVHNRLAQTRAAIACIRQQCVSEVVSTVVIDDGSNDGTAQWLAQQSDLHVITGDGSLWWGGAIHAGVSHVMQQATDSDWIVFLNNDTEFDADFLDRLARTARAHYPAAVGSAICDVASRQRVLSLGPVINAANLTVGDLLDRLSGAEVSGLHEVDALSGRGVIFPLMHLKRAGGMRPRALPHYFADYELSMRVRAEGCRILVDGSARVYSDDDYGSARQFDSLVEKYFSRRSPSYLPAALIFWWRASKGMDRALLLPRLVLLALIPALRSR